MSTVALGTGITEAGRDIAQRVDDRLREVLTRDRERYSQVAPQSRDVVDALLTAVLGGGKRLRPTLAHLAFTGAGGSAGDERIIEVGAALELLHAGCLVHDDVMDDSPVRRGLPTTHAAFGQRHALSGYTGEERRYGEGVATIVGDLAFFYAIGLLRGAGPDAQQVFFEMAVDAGIGQYLDLLAAAGPAEAAPDPLVIARYKTGRYTVEGPLRLGAALCGRLADLDPVFTAFGRPAGLAYQLRDDLIGAFGDPASTGKPVGDDLRQGKRTLLLAVAGRRVTDPAARDLLRRAGDGGLAEHEVPLVQHLLVDVGARADVEHTCQALAEDAVAALATADLRTGAKDTLTDFATRVAIPT
ncbi:polyprenyl synthetase family protein [Amycolatopsis magusensis]|uniref:Geranylgeranyl diphosphate synthase type I n=1 Tax=Amycolatopsis magusensis TaxID=882444 RepID=A0ABS4PYM1_9PSEU|nr:polyprenyl synthetase family protein [Amycolatopsis magusensis]MBP2184530.1 geranylgeranyl diphosphate synthase type I [Amycolatopsis magusensis]MDI5975569.1 polyprenyl synthetase family protein [Amycolatopsis magusensis]